MATTIPSTATEGQDIGGFDNGVIFMVENNTWIIQQAKINYESGLPATHQIFRPLSPNFDDANGLV